MLSDLAMAKRIAVWDSNCQDLLFQGDLQVKFKFDKRDESDKDFRFHGDSSDSVEKEYNTSDESEGDLGGSGDSGGTLHLRVSPHPSS